MPRPQRPGGPPIMIGGKGPKRTLPLVARYADEWNAVFISATQIIDLNKQLNELIVENGRQLSDVRRSLMTGCVFGRDTAEVERKFRIVANLYAANLFDDWHEHRIIVGEPKAIVDQLGKLEEIGIYRVMLQWLDLDDISGLETFASLVLPQLR